MFSMKTVSIFSLPCFLFFLFVFHLACSLPQCRFFLIWSSLFLLHNSSTVSSKTQNVKLSLKTKILKCLWYPATSHKKEADIVSDVEAKWKIMIQISLHSSEEIYFVENLMYFIRKKIKARDQACEELPFSEIPSHNFYHIFLLPNIPSF